MICPICERDVNDHTELESVTCVKVGRNLPTPDGTYITGSRGCIRCLEEESALRQVWSLIQERAHPTNLTWRCATCNKERQLTIN